MAFSISIDSHSGFGQLAHSLTDTGRKIVVTGLRGSSRAIVLAQLRASLDRPICIVAPDRESAGRLLDDMRSLAGGNQAHLLASSMHHSESITDHRQTAESVETILKLISSNFAFLVTTGHTASQYFPRLEDLMVKTFELITGNEAPLSSMVSKLEEIEFRREDFVKSRGEYAVRGGILDIFSFAGENPIRIEFFADSVESIREFDPMSQRSIKELSVASIVPNLLESHTSQSDSTLFELLPAETIVAFMEPETILAEVEKKKQHGVAHPVRFQEAAKRFSRLDVISIQTPDEPAIDFGFMAQPAFNGSVSHLRTHLGDLQRQGYKIEFSCDSHSEQTRLQDLLTINQETQPDQPIIEFDSSSISFSQQAIHEGFASEQLKFALYTEHQIFGRLKRVGRKRRGKFKGLRPSDMQKLRKGDYVVHMDFGIGIYDGLKKIRVRNVEQEVVKVNYAEKDTLYVNLNYIQRLQRYSSSEGHIPKLTRLGSGEWEKIKARTKKRIQDIARDLISLYAKRKATAGFSFGSDTPWQKELEASFLYEDTFDQAKATRDIKEDMEALNPMDRLICGDVGFGKTEVAVRAAFKAVLGGKQVAVLVPTTILALQHYNTFRDRTSRYATRVQMLSRFKSKKEQTEILQELSAGSIDIVIGTHRLLSKDVKIKNLGLLVIDEEHRFGVSAKEKLRSLKAEVDTLTLTATPIPRTLHFSLLGARDLSIIATPPRNRLSVITEITTYNSDIVREAIVKEKERAGQVYFVHDRVSDIEEVTQKVREAVPGVEVRFAHGQMTSHELERVMLAFYEKQFDVLVCTKIIESGLDIPNANTIVINRADRFGMAELYQLRGRVGRSNVQAYAYLLIPPVSSLPKGTVQRLQAVEEHTELGSGFHLAMRDLEIRGAGNLLGAEQSGFIESMGFDTYTKILEEAVADLKEQEFQSVFTKDEGGIRFREATVDADFDAFIPEAYIENSTERLDVYRKLYGVSTKEQLLEVSDEVQDRFGKPHVEVENLLRVVEIKLEAQKFGFVRVQIEQSKMIIDFPPETENAFYESDKFQLLMEFVSSKRVGNIFLKQEGKSLSLTHQFTGVQTDILTHAIEFLHSLSLLGEVEHPAE